VVAETGESTSTKDEATMRLKNKGKRKRQEKANEEE
jgi:hypothetical protein